MLMKITLGLEACVIFTGWSESGWSLKPRASSLP
jgi:hypothetical protein